MVLARRPRDIIAVPPLTDGHRLPTEGIANSTHMCFDIWQVMHLIPPRDRHRTSDNVSVRSTDTIYSSSKDTLIFSPSTPLNSIQCPLISDNNVFTVRKLQWCLFRGRSLASRQPGGSKGAKWQMTFKTKLHLCMKQRFQMQAKRVRCVCVLPQEFSLIHLHGFLTALPRPRLNLILNCFASPRPRQFFLGIGLGLVKLPHPHHWKNV